MEEMIMNIIKNTENNTLIVTLEGRLDTNTAPQLEQELKESFGDIKKLVLDMSGLEYISSAGLRVVLSAHKIMTGYEGMVIKNVNEEIKDIFDITGFSDVLNIEE
jgi:anti-sigma B factor antagonist